MQLFRQQALDHQNRLHGEVFLVPPLRWQAIGWLLLLATIACGLLLALGSSNRTIRAGGVILMQQGNTIAAKGATGAQWVAQLQVPLASAAKVAAGQPVSMTVRGYPAQTFGALQGTIVDVGATPVDEAEPYIPVTVRLDVPTLQQSSNGLVLRSNSRVDAAVTIGRISLLQWLFEPVLPAARMSQ